MIKEDVLIIGGGLAGLIASIHLSKIGISVTIFEKNSYPKHKISVELSKIFFKSGFFEIVFF